MENVYDKLLSRLDKIREESVNFMVSQQKLPKLNCKGTKIKKKYSVEYVRPAGQYLMESIEWTISNICIYGIPEGDRHKTFQK